MLLKVQKLNNKNEKLEETLSSMVVTLTKIEEFTSYTSETAAQLAEDQIKIQTTLSNVRLSVFKLKEANEQVKEYLSNSMPSDLARMYNEARTGK